MRKNKFSDILFGLLLFGFLVSNLTGCGNTPTQASAPAYTPSTARQTENDQETHEEVASQETEELQTEQEYGDETGAETDIVFPGGIEIYESETEVPETETNADNNNAYTSETDDGFVVGSDIASIKSVCGILAPVETDIAACHWDSFGEHPYDVVYDYGEEYMAYVDACDWSLVFDADYYMDTFPMLALQFHYDEEELLFHFQTVGIHEGRQGNADFNVYCYGKNTDNDLISAFGTSYEGYYLYYMLNYDTEKDVNTVTTEDMDKVLTMYKFHPTAMQTAELNAVGADREEIGVNGLKMNSEICAIANYRAYINAHDGYSRHDWAKANLELMNEYCRTAGFDQFFAENTVTTYARNVLGKVNEPNYYNSESHYNAMVNPKYNYIGVSNMCNGETYSSQFDFFMDTMN
ncbi:MAG: hypothetical protein NC398_10000 [Acetatifactor muris]|nr:hypothetical protein [Acetatifactor muris]MCM1525950.1 hypothetical protein [Bacteroides sp.]